MTYEIIFTEGGQKFYDHTVDYFVNVLNSPHIAAMWIKAVREARGRLETSAEAYQFYSPIENLRVIHLKKYKYKIFYEVRGDEVYIKAVLHNSQLPEKWLDYGDTMV